MAVVRVQLHHQEIRKIQYMPVVRDALRNQADAIASRARGLSPSASVSSSIFVEEGTRPKGRAYARAVSDIGRAGWGQHSKTQRREVLKRAADIRT